MIAIHYVALALSVITILISTLILAVVLIVCPSKGKDGVVEYVVLEKVSVVVSYIELAITVV